MWILIIIVLLVIYFSMKSKSTKNTKQVQTTGNAEPVKQAEKQKQPYDAEVERLLKLTEKQYHAETERLFQIAIKEVKEYKKIKSSILEYERSKSSFEYSKKIDKAGTRKRERGYKKEDREYDNLLQRLTQEAQDALEKGKKLDPEAKGEFICQYMNSKQRRCLKALAKAMRTGDILHNINAIIQASSTAEIQEDAQLRKIRELQQRLQHLKMQTDHP